MKKGLPFFLKKTHEYARVKASGVVVRCPYFTLVYSRVQETEYPRVGIVVGRRVGKAVERNRLKRIFRELVRAVYADMAGGHHCIVYPKAKILQSNFQEVQNAWQNTLKQVGIVQTITSE